MYYRLCYAGLMLFCVISFFSVEKGGEIFFLCFCLLWIGATLIDTINDKK